MSDAYAAAGVDTAEAGRALRALVDVLRTIDPGRPSRSVLGSGHYASVLALTDELGLALSTDGVGTKVVVAEQTGRYDTIGVDCIAMNVNDVVCVGAEPIALLDHLAVERADPDMLGALALGLKRGAEDAGIEIPGGELAQVPELVRGHPSPHGFDLSGTCVGTVALDSIVTGAACEPGNAIVGLPSSGLHSNGLTLARRALLADAGLKLDERPRELGGASVADALLEPTVIYVRAALGLLRSDVPVHGLAHITGDGLANLLRLEAEVGYEIDSPLEAPPVFGLIQSAGGVSDAEMHEVFNMGCGFCCIVPSERAQDAVSLLGRSHPGAAVIGRVSDRRGSVELRELGLVGDDRGLRKP
ncbi:MAG TPA: phosphoribosylformylglycinamidine cyclo-ligase [Solirubrobacteraceae bacterium]|nr:phosphoribosylformylglycinamidine cyclo-ligase [Solirubrobacteraceae bacterium]